MTEQRRNEIAFIVLQYLVRNRYVLPGKPYNSYLIYPTMTDMGPCEISGVLIDLGVGTKEQDEFFSDERLK